jgi:hypothetical protein
VLTEELTKLKSSCVTAAANVAESTCNKQLSNVVKRGKRGPRSGSGSGSLHRAAEASKSPPPLQEDSGSLSQSSNAATMSSLRRTASGHAHQSWEPIIVKFGEPYDPLRYLLLLTPLAQSLSSQPLIYQLSKNLIYIITQMASFLALATVFVG